MTANSDRPDDTIVVVPGEVIPPDETADSADADRMDADRVDEDEQVPNEPAAEPMAHRAWGGAVPSPRQPEEERQPEDEPVSTSDADVAVTPGPPGTPTGGLDAADTDPDVTGTYAAIPDDEDEDDDLDGTGLLDEDELSREEAHDTVMADTEGVPAPDLNGTQGSGRHAAVPEPDLAASSAAPVGAQASAAPVTDGQWSAIQAAFVDDPRQAVEQAAQAVSTALDELMSAARSREQDIRNGWQNSSTGTEDLRMALRGYRDLAGRVTNLASQF
jgi:hypothetical protein